MGRILPLFGVAIALLLHGIATPAADDEFTGVWEGEIQDPTRPVVVTVDFATQTASFSGATAVPFTTSSTGPNELRWRTRVLEFAGKRVSDSRIEGMLAGPQSTPFWLERLPALPPPVDRVDAWRQDLDVVATRFLRYDRSFTDRRRVAARVAIERLTATVAAEDDAHVTVELARIIASSGNAHTRLYLVRNRSEFSRLPIRVWWFRDQLRVVGATIDHQDLPGCRIMRLNGVSVAAAAARVRGIKAGNDSWQRYMSTYFLTSPDALLGANLADHTARTTLWMSCHGTEREVTLSPMPFHRSAAVVEAWWDLVPSYPHPDGSFMSALGHAALPRYLRNTQRNYWFEYVPEDATLYFQYNRAEQTADAPMDRFTARLLEAVDTHAVKGVVVDVRFNTGGDLTIATPLVETLASRLRRDRIPAYVLTSRATFSAGISHAAQWKQYAGATVIGEPAGDGLDMWSEGGNLVLPNSKLTVHYGNAFHSYSRRDYPERKPYYFDLSVDSLRPAVLIEPSWEDYIAGRDPLYEAAASRIRRTVQ